MNQCDGCRRGLPVVNGVHDLTDTVGSYPGEGMYCTKKSYEEEVFDDWVCVPSRQSGKGCPCVGDFRCCEEFGEVEVQWPVYDEAKGG